MNHLVQDGVLYHFFRQIDLYIDAQHKMLIPERSEQSLPPTHKRHLAQKSLGMAQFNRQRRQLTAEKLLVIRVKMRLNVF